MNLIASFLILVFVPGQILATGIMLSSREKNITATEKVEGATDEKKNVESSFRNSISSQHKEALSSSDETGLVPQRKTTFYNTKVFAGSSVVIDVETGTILHYDKGRTKTPIASLTKMMTAVIVVEKVQNLDEPVIIDEEAVSADGTKVGCPTSVLCNSERLHLNEKVSAKDLLMAMLLSSANDAAIALSKHVAGSQKAFAVLMNEKSRELNLGDSHFCNPSGLDEDGCYSSAYDIARITSYSMKHEIIWKIMKMQQANIDSCDGKYSHLLKNTDILLEQIPNCLGGKTGFTYNAGKSLLLAAADPEKGKHRIVAVIINDNNRWEDMHNLINWTFENYEWK